MTTIETEKTEKKLKAPKGAKIGKGAKAKGAKGAKGARKTGRKNKASTGQSAPHEEVKTDELNDKETKLALFINGDGKGVRADVNLSDMTKVFTKSASTKAQAYSWVRNSIRRLITGEFVEKISRGVFRVTEKGRKRLQRVEA